MQDVDLDDTRSAVWRDIWTQKFGRDDAPLHHADGFDLLSEAQWAALVSAFKRVVGSVEGRDVMEVGCGAGAFLQYFREAKSLSGVDYVPAAAQRIARHLSGKFYHAGADALPFADASFDLVLSFGVFFYFDSLAYARRALDEMLRTLRPRGDIFIFDVNDADKRDLAAQIRAQEGRKDIERSAAETSHLFYPKSFFLDYARSRDLKIAIVDETQLGAPFHSGVRYRFYVHLSRP